jgi:branched-subunit amino acid ABC-type transport system permease component
MMLLLKKTTLGIQLRASSEDFRMAQLTGVRANWVISSAFAITGVLAAAVAVLYVMGTGAVAPDIGQGPLFVAFVGGVIGGLGSLPGAALGGFVLGAIINALQATLPITLKSHTQLFAFLVVIAILVLIPNGLVSIRGVRSDDSGDACVALCARGEPLDVASTGRVGGTGRVAAARVERVLVLTWTLVDGFGDVVYKDTAVRLFLSLIIVLGLQIFSGNSGVLSFGHIAFMAIGAYMSALLTIPPEIKSFTYSPCPTARLLDPAREAPGPLEATLTRSWSRDALRPDHGRADRPADGRRGGNRDARAAHHRLRLRRPDVRGHARDEYADRRPQVDHIRRRARVGADLHRRRVRLQRVTPRTSTRASRENVRAARSVGVRVPIERAIAWVLSSFVVGVAERVVRPLFRDVRPRRLLLQPGLQHRPADDRDARRRR